MKGKVDKDGNLYLERTDVMRKQYCHHQSNFESGYGVECGDWCPLFSYLEAGGEHYINLCHGTELTLTELEVEK
jgi:hypothetical protein